MVRNGEVADGGRKIIPHHSHCFERPGTRFSLAGGLGLSFEQVCPCSRSTNGNSYYGSVPQS